MKKVFLILGTILIVLFGLLTFLDRSEYQVERRLWLVKKQFEAVARDPKAVPEKKFEAIVTAYKNIVKRYPSSRLLPRIYLQIGNVYIIREDYARARTIFTEMRQRFPQELDYGSEALFAVGNTYELEEDFKNALKTYRDVGEKYPLTPTGLSMPLYIANYYLRAGKEEEGKQALEEAISYYSRIEKENPRSVIGYSALRSLTTSYLTLQRWSAAVDSLGRMLIDFPPYLNSQNLNLVIKGINTISISELHDYDRPQGIYQTFIERYPQHPWTANLKEAIQALKELKETNKSEPLPVSQ